MQIVKAITRGVRQSLTVAPRTLRAIPRALIAIPQILNTVPAIEEYQIQRRIRREFDKSRPHGVLPVQLAIETVNRCNAACVMCPYPTLQRTKGIMSAETHKLIVDKVAAWGAPIQLISHAGMGEPLLDRTIVEKIRYEKSVFPKARVAIYSNVSALEEHRAEQLFDAKLDILSVSLNAFSKDVYETVMKLPYERTQKNLHRFIEMNNVRGKPVEIHVSLIPTEHHTKEEIQAFRDYWTPLVHNVVIPPYIGWGGHFETKTRKRQYSCRYVWQVMQVDWDGTVAMCCEDYETKFPLGNLTKQSPQDVYNSEMFQEQRRRQVDGDFEMPDICKNCIESQDVARDFWKTATVIPAPAPSK
ncbi:MAG: radical SAM/SPASM domain-containing protein [Ferrovibrio sp.]|uniref:radical SAM/SPASM domain-containing protein n=1 Tax=Ferrovibrio sp. TaxID=1917215 RepID=UPI00391C2FAE